MIQSRKNRKPISGIDTDIDVTVFLCYCKNNVFIGLPVKCVLVMSKEDIGVLMNIHLRIA